jgi:catechol 2,3-dioxygenase-like lactoylglutathione lyase family enzyme
MSLTSTASVWALMVAGVLPLLHVDTGSRSAVTQAAQRLPRFHHIHLVPGDPNQFADYYARLFVPRHVERGEFWGHPGVRDSRATLLFSAGDNDRRGDHSVVWQMGWGKVTLDQTYRQHYAREVDWAPPYASLSADLHLHIRTRDAKAAADWYRDVLGGTIELSRHFGAAEDGLTVAIVRFDGLTLALHATSGPVATSRDAGTVDHVAFAVATFEDLPIEPTLQLPGAPYALRAKRSALVGAPDGLVVEIIEEK